VKGVLDWPTSKGVKDIQKFLELVFITRLLHDLVEKDQKWDWTERYEKMFNELKERFIKELVLVVLDLDKKIRVEVDISDYAMGGVLSIEYKNG